MQAKKNLRQALKGEAAISEAGKQVSQYLNLPAKRRQQVDGMLSAMGLATIAHSCLVDGMTLEAAGKCGPYTTPAQRRSWAAGRLQAAIAAMATVGQYLDVLQEQKKIARDALFRERHAYAMRDRNRVQFEAEIAAEKSKNQRRRSKPGSDTIEKK